MRRAWLLLWTLSTAPRQAGQHLADVSLLRCLALPLITALIAVAINIPTVIVLRVDTTSNVLEFVPATVGTWIFLWLVPFTLAEWLLLTMLAHRPTARQSLVVACLSVAPLTLMSIVPVMGLFVAVPWMFGTRIGLMKAMTKAPGLELGLAALSPCVMLLLWLFAMRVDVAFFQP